VTDPRVSAICIFHNETTFLKEAIESVLAQTFDDYELLLVDDGSIPASTMIARDFARRFPGRIRYLEHEHHANRGMSATRNLGLAHAHGEFIAFIDADDVWPPNKLAEQVALFEQYREAGAVCGAVLHWRSWAGGKDRLVLTGHLRNKLSLPPWTALSLYPLGVARSPTTSAMVRRTVIEELGGFDDRFTGMFEDQVLFAKLYLNRPIYFSTSLWLKYRLHEDSCVASALRQGEYPKHRDAYFSWLKTYVHSRELVGKQRVLNAIETAQWRREDLFWGRLPTLHRRLPLRLGELLHRLKNRISVLFARLHGVLGLAGIRTGR
jgi:glycosyltransferase involved in cell wall biosynthesis